MLVSCSGYQAEDELYNFASLIVSEDLVFGNEGRGTFFTRCLAPLELILGDAPLKKNGR